LLASWPWLQVLPGSQEVATLRAALQAALPRAPPPEQQHVRSPAMLYTTVARLLAPARRPDSRARVGKEWELGQLQRALLEVARDVSDELCGLVTTFARVDVVLEHDLLALALDGAVTHHSMGLQCGEGGGGAQRAAVV
jgi:hypothetical protein